MTRLRLSRRTRSFLLWTARLALVAYLVQLSAVDHWPAHFTDVIGVEGSSAHVQHCHGAGDCSSSGGAAIAPSSLPTLLPGPAEFTYAYDVASQPAPSSAFVAPPSEPPQAA